MVPDLLADPGMIEHALVNLVQNAIHATRMSENPRIMFKTYSRKKNIYFEAKMKNFSRLSPKKEMVAVMSNEYAKLTGLDETKVFNKMWSLTEVFQKKYFRKIALKRKFLFWRNK